MSYLAGLSTQGTAFYFNSRYLGEIRPDNDGYMKWWPTKTCSCLDTHFLLAVAEFLHILNAEWDAKVRSAAE